MTICRCTVCLATRTYEDEFGDVHAGGDLSPSEYARHQLAERRLQSRLTREQELESERVGANVVLTTLSDSKISSMPVRHRDTETGGSLAPSKSGGEVAQASRIILVTGIYSAHRFPAPCNTHSYRRHRRADAEPQS